MLPISIGTQPLTPAAVQVKAEPVLGSIRLVTSTGWILLNVGLPCEVIVAGPIACSKGPTGLLGNAVSNCWIPVVVGTKPGEVLGEPPVRCRSILVEAKNHTLFF